MSSLKSILSRTLVEAIVRARAKEEAWRASNKRFVERAERKNTFLLEGKLKECADVIFDMLIDEVMTQAREGHSAFYWKPEFPSLYNPTYEQMKQRQSDIQTIIDFVIARFHDEDLNAQQFCGHGHGEDFGCKGWTYTSCFPEVYIDGWRTNRQGTFALQ